ncbi:hypothetical protein WR25_07758 [Diploscapter pachys]|uniref:Uncharacterized protein n=1 Tax=Diploscapter pachys TaxID=2018661 RepID=A0A2A2LA93_9BILA|nr:hypothetical protein WR25_07758 [Diploscapter pachys]
MPILRASTPWVSAGRLARKESGIVAPSFEAKKWCNVLLLAYAALLTQFLHSASTSLLTALEYRIALGVSILSLSFLILAAIGIRSDRSFALVPLFTLQTTALFFFGLTWGHTTFVLVKEQENSWPTARLLLVILYELLLLGLHLFCMRLVYVVIKTFYKFEKMPTAKTPDRRCSIPQFLSELDEESNEDKIVFEKMPSAPKKMSKKTTSFANPVALEQMNSKLDV